MNLRQAAQHALEVMDDHMYRADTHEFYEAKEALRAALAEPEQYATQNPLGGPAKVFDAMADAIRAGDDYHATLRRYGFAEVKALAEPEQEMPSDTRYTVVVEGQAPTYWDCIHDAMTNAQRAVYSGVDNTTRAIDDLKAGRIAEWSYGFSAVRIYPPQSKAAPTPRKPLTDEEAEKIIRIYDGGNSEVRNSMRGLKRAIERAHGITGEQT